MIAALRHEYILEDLKHNGAVTIKVLAKKLKTSASTIRRDLTELENQGLLTKVHGGAIAVDALASTDVQTSVRREMHTEEKRMIGRIAASLIQPGDLVFLDAGTTTIKILDHPLPDRITIVTNDPLIAEPLRQRGIKGYMLGGEIKPSTGAIVGEECIRQLQNLNFAIGFFGANAVSKDQGYTTPDVAEATVKRSALERCKKAYVVADQSKLGKSSRVRYAEIHQASLITEEGLTQIP